MDGHWIRAYRQYAVGLLKVCMGPDTRPDSRDFPRPCSTGSLWVLPGLGLLLMALIRRYIKRVTFSPAIAFGHKNLFIVELALHS